MASSPLTHGFISNVTAMGESPLTAETLIAAYASGYFPMAEGRHTPELFWFNPSRRGVLPLDDFHIPRSLKKFMKNMPYTMRVDSDFAATIRACADMERPGDGHWINEEIISRYAELHQLGFAHSVESWLDGELVGGLYGVSIGGAFFGESMFSRYSQASKVALVTLVELLNEAGYLLLDTQFVNDHLLQFGVKEIPRHSYIKKLDKALKVEPNPSSLFSTISVRKGLAALSNSSDSASASTSSRE